MRWLAAAASGHTDGHVRLWRPVDDDPRGTWSLRGEWAEHSADVRALVSLASGQIVSGSEDGTIRLWEDRAGNSVPVGRHEDFVTGMCLVTDGRLASASYDGTVKLWTLRTGLTLT